MSCPYFRGAAGAPERAAGRVATLAGHVSPEEAPAPAAALSLCPVAALAPARADAYAAELRACRAELLQLLDDVNCNPILVRFSRNSMICVGAQEHDLRREGFGRRGGIAFAARWRTPGRDAFARRVGAAVLCVMRRGWARCAAQRRSSARF